MTKPGPVDVLRSLDGSATSGELVALCGRKAVVRALRDQHIERTRRGYHALPALEPVLLLARRLHGIVSHESAALRWGIDVTTKPIRHHLAIGRQRRSLS